MNTSFKKYLIGTLVILLSCAELMRDFTDCRHTKHIYIINRTSDSVRIDFTDNTSFDSTSHWGILNDYKNPWEIPKSSVILPFETHFDSIQYNWKVEHGGDDDYKVSRDPLFTIIIDLNVRSGDSLIRSYAIDMHYTDFTAVDDECSGCITTTMFCFNCDTIEIKPD